MKEKKEDKQGVSIDGGKQERKKKGDDSIEWRAILPGIFFAGLSDPSRLEIASNSVPVAV